MTFSTQASVKTDDTLVAWGNHYFKVIQGSDPEIFLRLRDHHFQNVSTVDSNINLPLPWHQKIITFFIYDDFFLKRKHCPFKLMMCRWHLRAKMCFKGIKEGEHIV